MMTTPDYLVKGDRIAIVAPAGKIAPEKVEAACEMIERWGLKIDRGENIQNDSYQYSAEDDKRLLDLQHALDDPSVKAVLCARGGYGTIRIIDRIDFEKFRESPKWVIGFSDITALHGHIHTHLGIETVHGSMAAGLVQQGPAADTLKSVLFGEKISYSFNSHSLSRAGKANGQLVGGNLAILTALIGTPSDIRTDGKVLFIEEIGEHLYRIDRMMWTLKRAGKLDHLSGLIAGGMTDIPDSRGDFGKDAREIILEHVKEYDYPVCFDFPAGHQEDNRAMILGRTISLEIDSKTTVTF